MNKVFIEKRVKKSIKVLFSFNRIKIKFQKVANNVFCWNYVRIELLIVLTRFKMVEIANIKPGFLFKNGNYEVLKQIGEGGFGIIYLVKDNYDENEPK